MAGYVVPIPPPKPAEASPLNWEREKLVMKVLSRDVIASPAVRALVGGVLRQERLPLEVLRRVFVEQRTLVVTESKSEHLGLYVHLVPPADSVIILSQRWSEVQTRLVLLHELAHAWYRHNPSNDVDRAEGEVEARLLVMKWGYCDQSDLATFEKPM